MSEFEPAHRAQDHAEWVAPQQYEPLRPEGPPPPPPARRPSRLPALFAAVAILCLAGGVGIGYALPHSHSSASAKPSRTAASAKGASTIDVEGTLTLTTTSLSVDDNGCSGTGGYDDIATGAQVVISDDSGKTLQIVSLGVGMPDNPDLTTSCSFTFTATVPAGKGFYGVEVTHRGVVKEPESAIATVSLTLGD